MGAICGILGKCDTTLVDRMAHALRHRGDVQYRETGETYALAASEKATRCCVIDGDPRDDQDTPLAPLALTICLKKGIVPCRGAFAAVVGSDDGKEWWLLRDRLGRRPLYYCIRNGSLLFASELKALLATGVVSRHLNLPSVDRYFTLRCVPGPESIVQDVFRVPPGQAIHYGADGIELIQTTPFDLSMKRVTKEQAAAEVRDRLRDAATGTPPSVLLWSAGVDCAALAALRPDLQPLFVNLEQGWQDEMRLARESARRMGIALEPVQARRLTEKTFSEVVRSLDEPFADASVFPLWLILEQVATQDDCAISGHGADELLGGYPRYHFLQKAQGAKGLVPTNQVAGLLPSLPPNAFVRRGSRYLAEIKNSVSAYLSILSVFDNEERDLLYTDAMKASLHEHHDANDVVRAHFTDSDLTRNIQSLDIGVMIPDLLVACCERIGAAQGVTLTFPYLDDRLVDLAVSLPPEVKYGVRSKPLLRSAMKGLLPARIRQRARRGFRIPKDGRLAGLIDNMIQQIITPERVDGTGLFKWPYVAQILRSAQHNVFRRRQFWALLMFFAWYKEVMED